MSIARFHPERALNKTTIMKKILIAAMVMSLAAATQVGALTVHVSEISGYNAGQGGGEFNVTPITGVGYAPSVLVGGGFETFCLSRDTGITIPGDYNATVNANGVYDNGINGAVRTMSLGSAYLYQQFATGVLAGYRYGQTGGGTASGRATDAYNLQLAIWTLEGDYSYGSLAADLANAFINTAANFFGGGIAGLQAAMLANGAGGFGVGALNLRYIAGNPNGVPPNTPAQPLLTLLPDGGTTLMLMGIGFSSLALVSRKFRA